MRRLVTRGRGDEDISDLCKHSVNLIDVHYNIRVCVFILEKESTEVVLATFHHIFDGCDESDDGGVAYDDCFVKAQEDWATGT